MRLYGWWVGVALVLVSACGARSTVRLDVDGDASTRDASTRDASTRDASTGEDGSVRDTGLPDVGTHDASQETPDAAMRDGGTCGNGVMDEGEQCDLGDDNGAGDACCTEACQFDVSGRPCRIGSGDVCDPVEVCSGTSDACPFDTYASAGTTCRVGADHQCDPSEVCSGMPGIPCPADRAPLDEGSACTDGGNTCCNTVCENRPTPGLCDPCGLRPVQGRRVTIIDDTLTSSPTSMQWNEVALGLGLNATFAPLSALDHIDNLDESDAVILTHHTDVTDTHRLVLQQVITRGSGVYVQGEWEPTYAGNQVFARLVNELGGNFVWDGNLADNLAPTVSGCLSRYPNEITSLSYFWWGATGSGTVDTFLSAAGGGVGFSHCPSLVGAGPLIYTSDRDWIGQPNAQQEAQLLMANILTRLAAGDACR